MCPKKTREYQDQVPIVVLWRIHIYVVRTSLLRILMVAACLLKEKLVSHFLMFFEFVDMLSLYILI